MTFTQFYTAPSGIPYLVPSGDGGDTDADHINAMLAAGKPVFLLPAAIGATPFTINQPINQWKSGSFMSGFQWYAASFADNYGAGVGGPGGAELYVTPSFPGGYAIDLVNDTGSQFYGVDLSGFTLYDNDNFAQSGGIRVHGAWGAGFLRGFAVEGTTLDCLHFEVSGTSGKEPDEWAVSQAKLSVSYHGYGVWADNLPDSTFTDVISTSHDLDAWNLGFSFNTRFNNCRGEQSNGAGFRLPGQAAGRIVTLNGCTTQFNKGDGFLFDNTAGAGTGLGTYQLNGCVSTNDNQAGGATTSGFRTAGCLARVMGTGCFAAGSVYGAYEGGASYGMAFTASSLAGTTAATHDDGTNTHVLVNQSPVPF